MILKQKNYSYANIFSIFVCIWFTCKFTQLIWHCQHFHPHIQVWHAGSSTAYNYTLTYWFIKKIQVSRDHPETQYESPVSIVRELRCFTSAPSCGSLWFCSYNIVSRSLKYVSWRLPSFPEKFIFPYMCIKSGLCLSPRSKHVTLISFDSLIFQHTNLKSFVLRSSACLLCCRPFSAPRLINRKRQWVPVRLREEMEKHMKSISVSCVFFLLPSPWWQIAKWVLRVSFVFQQVWERAEGIQSHTCEAVCEEMCWHQRFAF